MQEVLKVNMEIVDKLKKQIAQLASQVQTMQSLKEIKIADTEVFEDKCSTLRRYLTSINIYIQINNLSTAIESNKVMFADTYLWGAVFD